MVIPGKARLVDAIRRKTAQSVKQLFPGREDRSLEQNEFVKENDFEDPIITEAFSADVVPVVRQNPALRVVADETVSSCNLPYGLSSTELSFLRVLIDATILSSGQEQLAVI